jgi:hypothetical protein
MTLAFASNFNGEGVDDGQFSSGVSSASPLGDRTP